MTTAFETYELEPGAREKFDLLLGELARAYEAEGRPGGDEAVTALKSAIGRPFRRRPGRSDAGPLLEAACGLVNALPIARRVLECASLLDWECWEGTGLAEDISSNLHTTELVGPDGHIYAESARVGLLVSERGTDYPISSHSGEETYLVIAGVAEWTVGAQDYTPQPPGSLVHHPAWVPHGRRTANEPFLGAWRWSGDLDLSSFSVSE
ncbi:dimethylsulfonioproprionate lyase family protein [Denitrobaculum tricleocarpae]|uniref:Cupin domain-containing protein n=1 Tax=Denitrobaculum tricleocarpae TaxID=2591009 RepID=A0A545TTU8_9PROT|nr:dimethylsulfonioproprionate lyase family protein [Denitrobaculum tricleocarpae]TQV80634.1 hypothetical protein FKG95_10740 [Denitrobaculum tricleocarpae]